MIGLEGTLVYCKGVASSASARAGEAHERRGAALLMYFSGFPAHFLSESLMVGGARGGQYGDRKGKAEGDFCLKFCSVIILRVSMQSQ